MTKKIEFTEKQLSLLTNILFAVENTIEEGCEGYCNYENYTLEMSQEEKIIFEQLIKIIV